MYICYNYSENPIFRHHYVQTVKHYKWEFFSEQFKFILQTLPPIKKIPSKVLPVRNNLFTVKFMWLKCFFHLLLAVSISFENYRAVHPAYRDDDEDDEEVDQDEVENRKSAWGTSVFILFLSSYQSILHIIFLFFSLNYFPQGLSADHMMGKLFFN